MVQLLMEEPPSGRLVDTINKKSYSLKELPVTIGKSVNVIGGVACISS